MAEQPRDYFAAMAAVRKPLFLKTPKYQEQQGRAIRDGAHPDILEFERRLVKRLASIGVPVYAHCVIRTEDEQRALVRLGNSKDSPDDGLWPHQGYAVDIVHGVLAWDMPKHCWDLIGHMGKEISVQASIPVVWGGDFKSFWDPAHWELKGWKQMAQDGVLDRLNTKVCR